MLVQNKTIVLTGAGNGMGRELCLQLLKKGARVAAIDLRSEALEETRKLAADISGKMSVHVLNISDRMAVEALPTEIIKQHGAVDGLINNAGIIQPFVKINQLDYAAIDRVMQVNFFGLLYMTKTFLPFLLKRPEAHIVNTSSMGGFLPVPGQSVYGASKAAVKLFTEGLRSELLDTGVKVTVVFPGAIGTQIAQNSGVAGTAEMEKQARNSSIKMLSPSEAATQIIRGMEQNAYRVLVGSDAKFMDKLYRLNPRFAAEFISKKMKALLSA
ncbi:MAG TPA: SDR family oxidoreductase [Bacteroidia bacterium]|nr:SDR family oxidoreductase [Bacteroidia bacterium]